MDRLTLYFFAALLVSADGCALTRAPQMIANREAVRRSLPPDISLETIAQRPSRDVKITVEQELIRLGAHVDEDGKLRDAPGKEIRFFHESAPPGTPPIPRPLSPEELEKQRAWEQFQKDFTVIFITWNPEFGPKPCNAAPTPQLK